MARRRQGDGSQSFDSLLDTMTNVVGILVIMLVVTLLGTRDAVRRIKWEIPDISQEKLEEFRRLADLKKQELSDSLADIKETQEVLAKLTAIDKEIKELEKSLELDSPEARLEQQKKELEELLKRKEKLDKEKEVDEKAIERLRKQLASIPESKPSAAKVIRMPNPRAAPPGIQPVRFMCKYNRIARLDYEELLEEALSRIASSRYSLSCRERGRVLKVPSDKEKRHPVLREAANWVFDPERLTRYFEQKDLGNRDFRLSLQLHKTLGKEYLYAGMRKDGGEGIKHVRSTVSRFEALVRDIDPEKQYAFFLVCPDSFEVYVRAREIIEEHDVPAGWAVYTGGDLQIAYDFGINVKGEKEPQPAPQTAVTDAKPATKVAPRWVLD